MYRHPDDVSIHKFLLWIDVVRVAELVAIPNHSVAIDFTSVPPRAHAGQKREIFAVVA